MTPPPGISTQGGPTTKLPPAPNKSGKRGHTFFKQKGPPFGLFLIPKSMPGNTAWELKTTWLWRKTQRSTKAFSSGL